MKDHHLEDGYYIPDGYTIIHERKDVRAGDEMRLRYYCDESYNIARYSWQVVKKDIVRRIADPNLVGYSNFVYIRKTGYIKTLPRITIKRLP